MKLRSIVSSLIAASLVLASTHPVDAQNRRPARVSSLTEMPCQNINGLYLKGINEDIPVGLEIFRAVSRLVYYTLSDGIIPKQAVQIACRLAQVREKPKYKTLTIAFAMSDSNPRSNGSQIRFSVYKDGKPYGYKDVTKGEKLLWQVDVTGVRSLALEVECIRDTNFSNWKDCPPLYFFEDTLK
ncbi:hypothetical protein amyaer_p04785 (plasmid) [Microcystis aeruginosa NIES-2481]|uniref:NPCBM/NEW2 domain-containing protein n=1 Tax=Microcystis aeruginosa TaxID=1126 RepID=UPI000CA2C86A|nr:NPCBM/NEW2 domain-containing protein [Microcystis aeruginosa]AUS35916.1 hypothetical protein amyaer_p04785 [Microcystis aeruginosa NIES-2481]